MESHLRPLSLGEILDRMAQLYRTNFVLFAGISAVYAGFIMVLNMLLIGLGALLTARHVQVELHWTVQVFSGIILLLTYMAGGVAVAANNQAVAWVHMGEPATIRSAYQSILPRIGRYLWLMFLKTFFAGTPLIVLYAAFIGVIIYFQNKGVIPQPGSAPQAAAAAHGTEFLVFGGISLILGLLMFPALIYCILMGLRYALAVPACVVENLRARPAIKRSIGLSKWSRGRIFMLWLLVAIVEVGLLTITQIFFVIPVFKHHQQLPVGLRVLQQFVAFLTNSFVGPILATGLTLFYYDQRVRKEGYDIEWMMQAAGLTVPTPAAPPGPPQTVMQVEPTAPATTTEPAPHCEPAQAPNSTDPERPHE
jgi:hypothetical protein